MIFQATWRQVLDGSKTQTRRIVGTDHHFLSAPLYSNPAVYVYHGKYSRSRTLWRVGSTYAVQSGCGRSAVWYSSDGSTIDIPSVDCMWSELTAHGFREARIRITRIRQERVQDISEADAIAEGSQFGQNAYGDIVTPVEALAALWDTLHDKRGERWADNPAVWVLEFELVEAA